MDEVAAKRRYEVIIAVSSNILILTVAANNPKRPGIVLAINMIANVVTSSHINSASTAWRNIKKALIVHAVNGVVTRAPTDLGGG